MRFFALAGAATIAAGVAAFARPGAGSEVLVLRRTVDAKAPLAFVSGPSWPVAVPGSVSLARVDPRTLQPMHGRRVVLRQALSCWTFSPDRSLLVLGSGHG